VGSTWNVRSLLVLSFLSIETLGNIHLDRVLNTGQSIDTNKQDGNKNEQHDKKGGDEAWSEKLVAFENSTLWKVIFGGCENRGACASFKGRARNSAVDNEVVGECLGKVGEFLSERLFCFTTTSASGRA
jgi:hypothetical protein